MNLRKWATITIAICVAALAGASVHFRPERAIRVATGYVAHNICSKTFVSGLDPQIVFAEVSDRAGIRRLRHMLRFTLDRAARTVDVSTLGLFRSRAAFHDGFGCVDLHGPNAPYLLKSDVEALKAKTPPSLPEIAGPAVVEPDLPSLTKTATARSSCMAIIQAWVFSGSDVPYSAVPVLASTAGPGRSPSTRPLPSVTTARIISRSCRAS